MLYFAEPEKAVGGGSSSRQEGSSSTQVTTSDEHYTRHYGRRSRRHRRRTSSMPGSTEEDYRPLTRGSSRRHGQNERRQTSESDHFFHPHERTLVPHEPFNRPASTPPTTRMCFFISPPSLLKRQLLISSLFFSVGQPARYWTA
jgi:hypothetical protein